MSLQKPTAKTSPGPNFKCHVVLAVFPETFSAKLTCKRKKRKEADIKLISNKLRQ